MDKKKGLEYGTGHMNELFLSNWPLKSIKSIGSIGLITVRERVKY
jgi:hypothetical protein